MTIDDDYNWLGLEDLSVRPTCVECGTILRHEEYSEFENLCECCAIEVTQGIISDNPYRKL